VLPAFLAIAAIVLFPLGFALTISLRRALPDLSGPFVGLENYAQLLADVDFRAALVTTAIFAVASTVVSVVVGLGTAIALRNAFRGRSVALGLMILPALLPTVASAAIFRSMLVGGVGVVDFALDSLGLVNGPVLVDNAWMIAASVLVDAWRTAPFVALLILAALRRMPEDLEDAALVDGASRWQRSWRVTLPLLRPTLLIVSLFRLLDATRVFDIFWVMTQRQLDSISTVTFTNVARTQLGFSLGNAAAVVIFVGSGLLSAGVIAGAGLRSEGALSFSSSEPGLRRLDASSSFRRKLLLITLLAVVLAPIIWVVRTSLLRGFDLSRTPPLLWPAHPELDAYRIVVRSPEILHGLVNSTVVALLTTAACLALAAPAAYGMTRLRSSVGRWGLPAILALAFFPQVVVLAPLFILFHELGILNTYWALIIPNTAFVLPLATWLLVGYFRELSGDLQDAARVDGATMPQLLTRVVAPLTAPGLAVAAAVSFVLVYNEFIFANTFTFDPSTRPITVVLSDIVAMAVTQCDLAAYCRSGYNFVAAASVVVVVVLAALVLPLALVAAHRSARR
jgi:trehalose/maltose transport system permease protein